MITSYDGLYYQVRYPKDGDEEELSDTDFDGSDIEFLPGQGGMRFNADDTDSETEEISRQKRPDRSTDSADELSDDEAYNQVVTVSASAAGTASRRKKSSRK